MRSEMNCMFFPYLKNVKLESLYLAILILE